MNNLNLVGSIPAPYSFSVSERCAYSGREVFYRLMHFHEFSGNQRLAQHFIRHFLETARRRFSSRFKPYSADAVAALQFAHPQQAIFHGGERFQEALRQAAPVALTECCWLRDVCVAASNQDPIAAALFRLSLDLDESAHAQSYLTLLADFGVERPMLYQQSYCRQTTLHSAFFDFAAIQLAMAYVPRARLPEMLGFTLAYCRSISVPEHCCPGEARDIGYFTQRQERLARKSSLVERLIGAYLNTGGAHSKRRWERVQSGFWLYQYLFDHASGQIQRTLTLRQSPASAMLNLLRRKAAAAIGHHRNVQLDGRSLNEWFARLPDHGEEFLSALARSTYVDRARPERSRLLKLFAFDGPMFGILDAPEISVVRNWLNEGANSRIGAVTPTQLFEPAELPKAKIPAARLRFDGVSNRRLYYYLINAERYPERFPRAEANLKRLLAICRMVGRPPFKSYSHAALEQYLQTVYRREMEAYRPLTGKPKISRAAYRWGFEQVAPTVLVDGVWLQHCRWLQFRYPEISAILSGIYADELGNGNLEQSHPAVFRRLLRQLDLELPAIDRKAFSEYRGFVDSAFDLPVFMLTLARFPQRYLPELLGLNMAIELSGLGKTYLRMVDELEHWHIDSTIARLHVTIDNFADGHSAKAMRAIQYYMDEVLAAHGERAMQEHWRRIYTGYTALKVVSWRFKLAVPAVYMKNKICRSLRDLFR